jgi:predicted extracellular nuclease
MSPVAASSRWKPVCLCLAFVMALFSFSTPGIAEQPDLASTVRISQVYGAGGNSSSTYGCDFIELFNASAAPVELQGWSVQYHNGASWAAITPGVIKIPASGYFLLAKPPCNGSGRPSVPPPDFATGTISLSSTSGRAALVRNEETIKNSSDPDIADLVGYGNVPEYEGSGAAPTLGATTSAQRKGGGCVDSDDNRADFEALTPLARNSSSPTRACSDDAPAVLGVTPVGGSVNVALDSNLTVTFSEPITLSGEWFRVECDLGAAVTPSTAAISGGPVTFTIDPGAPLYADDSCALTIFAADVGDQDAVDPPDRMAADYRSTFSTAPGACGDPAYPIHALQGAESASPAGGAWRTVEAVVTGDYQGADRLNGYFVQQESAAYDGDPATSEALFVVDAAPALLDVAAGMRVRLSGRVAEVDDQTALTELTRALDCGVAALPPAVPVDLPAPSAEPSWWERFEGMRVVFDQPLTVAGTDELGAAGRIRLISGDRPIAYTQANPPGASGYAAFLDDLSSRTVLMDDDNDATYPAVIPYPPPGLSAVKSVRVGDRIAAGLTGILDGRDNAYRLRPASAPVFVAANPRPAAPARQGNARVAFLPLDDYFTPNDGAYGTRGASNDAELTRQRDKLVSALMGLDADIIAVSDRENDGYEAGSALADLTARLNAELAGGAFALIGSGSETWGGGAATVGLIYRQDRVTPAGSPAILDTGAFAQQGTDPVHAAPLAQSFEEAVWGERFTVVVNQWHDRAGCPANGADADQADGQGCWSAARTAAAEELAEWLASDPTNARDPDILIVGELNAFRLESPVRALVDAGYADLVERFAGEPPITYLWGAEAGYSDHAFASPAAAAQVLSAAVWSINADEPRVLDYQTENKTAEQVEALYAPDPFRSSDHDPLVVDLSLLPDQSDFAGEYGAAWHTGQGAWRLGSAWGGADDGVLRGAGSWNDGQAEVTVSLSGPAGEYACLHAWLDYSDGLVAAGKVATPNGRWDANEEVIDALSMSSGAGQSIAFPLPPGVIDASATYNMRFRLIPAADPLQPACVDLPAANAQAALAPTGRADGGEVEDWQFSSGPLAVQIAAFEARIVAETSIVTWETVDEIDLLAFDLFGAPTEQGPWVRLNRAPIPAKAPGATEGRSYAYSHRLGEQARCHRLEALETSGMRYSFGPVRAEESQPNAVNLSGSAAERIPAFWIIAGGLCCVGAALLAWMGRLGLRR